MTKEKSKLPFSARISQLTRSLIDCEIEENGGSESDALQRLLVRAAGGSIKATQIVLNHLENDPDAKSFVNIALRYHEIGDADVTFTKRIVGKVKSIPPTPASSAAQPFPADVAASAALKSAVSGLRPKLQADASTARTSEPASTGQKRRGVRPKPLAPAPK